MRFVKKITALILTMVMLVVAFAVPASAYTELSPYWTNYIKSFDEICMNIDRIQYGETIRALQRYLMCFDYVCKGKLYYNGSYMDGDFGGRTKDAVLYLQEQLGFTGKNIDGIVGENTWGAIARSLRLYGEYYNRIRRPNGIQGQWVYGIGANDGIEFLGYIGEDNGNVLTPI